MIQKDEEDKAEQVADKESKGEEEVEKMGKDDMRQERDV